MPCYVKVAQFAHRCKLAHCSGSLFVRTDPQTKDRAYALVGRLRAAGLAASVVSSSSDTADAAAAQLILGVVPPLPSALALLPAAPAPPASVAAEDKLAKLLETVASPPNTHSRCSSSFLERHMEPFI